MFLKDLTFYACLCAFTCSRVSWSKTLAQRGNCVPCPCRAIENVVLFIGFVLVPCPAAAVAAAAPHPSPAAASAVWLGRPVGVVQPGFRLETHENSMKL